MVGNAFPGFVGKPGSYPVDLELPQPEPQQRLVSLFRLVLGFPALLIASALGGAVFTAAFLGWFVGLILGRMPEGLRNLGAYGLRYGGQTYAYLYFLTGRYPDSGPRPDPVSPCGPAGAGLGGRAPASPARRPPRSHGGGGRSPVPSEVAGSCPARPEDHREDDPDDSDDEQDVADRVDVEAGGAPSTAQARIAPAATNIRPTPMPILIPPR
jgi:hypothetical protein